MKTFIHKISLLCLFSLCLLGVGCSNDHPEWEEGDPALAHVYYYCFEKWGTIPGGNDVTYTVRQGETLAVPTQFYSSFVRSYSPEVYYYTTPDPEAVDALECGTDYVVTANEGDSREWGDYLNEVERNFKDDETSPTGKITADNSGLTGKVVFFDSSDYDGLDTNLNHLEENGVSLSGGQWQRLAIARAYMARGRYLLLDEPTASIDPVAESRMYREFVRILKGKGAVIVSHRLASAMFADRILVFDQGRIVESGSHEALLAGGGLYCEMFRRQAAWYRDTAEGGEA